MWRSQLSNDEWLGLHETIALRRDMGRPAPRDPSLAQRRNIHRPRPRHLLDLQHPARSPRPKGNLRLGRPQPAADTAQDQFHLREIRRRHESRAIPPRPRLPAIANVFVTLDGTHAVSATNALLAALTAPYKSHADVGSAYDDLARVAHELTESADNDDVYIPDRDNFAYLKTALAVLISAAELDQAPRAALQKLMATAKAIPHDAQLQALLTRAESFLLDTATITCSRAVTVTGRSAAGRWCSGAYAG